MSAEPKVGRGWHRNVLYAAEADVRRMARNGDLDITPVAARVLFDQVVAEQGRRDAHAVPTLRFYTRETAGSGWAHYLTGEVSLNRRGLRASTVLHELAHTYCPDDRGHGKQFRAEYLRLADIYMPTFGTRLRNALRRRKVDAADRIEVTS